MRTLPLAALAAVVFAPVAKADKFWLVRPDAQAKMVEGSDPDVIQGVLIAEDQKTYHLRIVGGELFLDKARVFRVEKDGLTIDAVVGKEKADADRLAAADRERQLKAAAPAPRVAAGRTAVDAAARRVEASPVGQPPEPAYDPVIHRLAPVNGLSDRELYRELELAYTVTRDQRYLKLLRKLRSHF